MLDHFKFKSAFMKNFSVEVLSFKTIDELPNSWQKEDYLELLRKMDYDNPEQISDAELKEMALMSITDSESAEAAQVVLEYLFTDQLTTGQIENLAHQMLTEKLWEEYPELSLHQGFFKATQLLYAAYNGKFPRAEAVQFQMKVRANDTESLALFDEHAEAPLLRLIAQGMPDNSLLNRLFSDQLEGASFTEAKNIIWQLKVIKKEGTEITFDVVSSAYWLEDFKYADSYEAATHADSLQEEES